MGYNANLAVLAAILATGCVNQCRDETNENWCGTWALEKNRELLPNNSKEVVYSSGSTLFGSLGQVKTGWVLDSFSMTDERDSERELPDFEEDVECIVMSGNFRPSGDKIYDKCKGLLYEVYLSDIASGMENLKATLIRMPALQIAAINIDCGKPVVFDMEVFSMLSDLRELYLDDMVSTSLAFANLKALNDLRSLRKIRLLSSGATDFHAPGMIADLDGFGPPALEELDLSGVYLFDFTSLKHLEKVRIMKAPIYFNSSFLPPELQELDCVDSRGFFDFDPDDRIPPKLPDCLYSIHLPDWVDMNLKVWEKFYPDGKNDSGQWWRKIDGASGLNKQGEEPAL